MENNIEEYARLRMRELDEEFKNVHAASAAGVKNMQSRCSEALAEALGKRFERVLGLLRRPPAVRPEAGG